MRRLLAPLLMVLGVLPAGAQGTVDFTLSSPDSRIAATLTFDRAAGTLSYRVRSGEAEIISASPIGIQTSRGDFRAGMALAGSSRETIDESYSLPQGKVSRYRNHANQLTLRFTKGGQETRVRFRAYDDGVAYGFVIPGTGEIEFQGESSAVTLAGDSFSYYGQSHPNDYGYESSLGPVTGERVSNPVLAHLHDRDHWVLIGQAATYGSYVQAHLRRAGSSFRYSYPLDQDSVGPVRGTLPFESPWRMVIVSPRTPKRIIESYLVENLNPPTDPGLLDPDGTVQDWIRPGRVMWDYLAGDRDKPGLWVDAAARMGWEYYMADAGFADRFGGEAAVREATRYAAEKGVGILGWAHTRDLDTYEKAAETLRRYSGWGLKGAKIDFFDHNTLSSHPRDWADYEDTQRSLQMRDWIFRLGIQHRFLLELHGNTIPTGERRRYPNLMTLEGVNGMERRTPNVTNDLSVPFIRNVMGPVSYTVIKLNRSPGSHAYQLAMPIVYEAGLMIYAEHADTLIAWPGRELIADLPSAWDETRFIEGMPGSHVLIARRKGEDWYLGGMTSAARSAAIDLGFLAPGRQYELLLFRDETHTSLRREVGRTDASKRLSIEMAEKGGFALRLRPATTNAAVYEVGSVAELQARIGAARPGDSILLRDGVYATSAPIRIDRPGTATAPIRIAAKSVGGATISGTHGFEVAAPAAHVVIEGFLLTHAAGTNQVRHGAGHVRFTRNVFENRGEGAYLTIAGDDAEVDRNEFRNKATVGNMIDVRGEGRQVAQRVRIHRNYFHDFNSAGANGAETIRFGLSGLSMSKGYGVIEHNLFVRCVGENELLSIKSGSNTIRYNSFVDSPGAQLTLRHGNENRVYGNFLRGTDGIRVFGDRHHVFSNYLEGNTGALNIGNGGAEVADGAPLTSHDRPDDNVIAFNTLVDNERNFYMTAREGGLGAINTVFANNIVVGGGAAVSLAGPYAGGTWEGNIIWRTAGESTAATGFEVVDPMLVRSPDGLLRPAPGSPAIDSVAEVSPRVDADLDGQPPVGRKDRGADEASTAPVSAGPLTVHSVGPAR